MSYYHVLIAGVASAGKSASLRHLSEADPKKVAYISAEANKSTPFPNNFWKPKGAITNPHQVVEFFRQAELNPNIEYCVLDGFNFLMDLYENTIVKTATNTQKAWGDYGTFINNFFQQVVGPSTKKWFITAHNNVELTPEGTYRYYVPIKGSAGKIGLESYFNIVVYAMRQPLAKLEEFSDANLLNITARDSRLGYKHVFQVQPTRDMADSRIRDLLGMWDDNQIWIDNDVALLAKHLDDYTERMNSQ